MSFKPEHNKTLILSRQSDTVAEIAGEIGSSENLINPYLSNKILSMIPYPIFIIDSDSHDILAANSAGTRLYDKKSFFYNSIISPENVNNRSGSSANPIDEVKQTGKPYNTELIIPPDGRAVTVFDILCLPVTDNNGRIDQIILIAHEMTRHKMIEKAHQITSDILRRERSSLKRKNLMQQALIARHESEKQLLHKYVQSNIDNVAMPALKALESRLDKDSMEYLKSIKQVLAEICSPYISNLESEYPGMTPREIETCNLIKHGMSSKDIASTMGLSVKTVHLRRKAIRRKLGLTRKRVSLQRFLQNV